MSNGNEMMDDLKFEELIKNFSPSERFLARQIRDVQIECSRRKYCMPSYGFTRKQIAAGGGLVTVISALIYLISKLLENFGG